jgi:hypothetical protein
MADLAGEECAGSAATFTNVILPPEREKTEFIVGFLRWIGLIFRRAIFIPGKEAQTLATRSGALRRTTQAKGEKGRRIACIRTGHLDLRDSRVGECPAT